MPEIGFDEVTEISPDFARPVSQTKAETGESEIGLSELTKSAKEALELWGSHDVQRLGALAIVGMKAAFPERFSNEQLRDNPNLYFFDKVVWLGMEVNDAVDMLPYARKVHQETAEDIFRNWKHLIRHSREKASETEEPEENIQLIENYQREILFCEKVVRETPEDMIDLEKVKQYREVMNAISLVHNAAALMGPSQLGNRMATIRKSDLSWETLIAKYSWVVDGNPQNDTERRLCALYNLVMGVQVIDDYCDLKNDRELGLRTIATEVLKDNPDKSEANRKINAEAEFYFEKAEDYGVTWGGRKGMKHFFKTLKVIQRKFPNIAGGRREKLLNAGRKIIEEPMENL